MDRQPQRPTSLHGPGRATARRNAYPYSHTHTSRQYTHQHIYRHTYISAAFFDLYSTAAYLYFYLYLYNSPNSHKDQHSRTNGNGSSDSDVRACWGDAGRRHLQLHVYTVEHEHTCRDHYQVHQQRRYAHHHIRHGFVG